MTRTTDPQQASGNKAPLAALTLGALGVVFGDIGTSTLYAFRQCFQNLHERTIDPASVTGIFSLIFWSLILVVCVKYVTFILRADHDAEGGILAMLALIHSKRSLKENRMPGLLTLSVLFGSALLYGDGVITPSISVLSAIEGLKIGIPAANQLIVPIALGILIGLFYCSKKAPARSVLSSGRSWRSGFWPTPPWASLESSKPLK